MPEQTTLVKLEVTTPGARKSLEHIIKGMGSFEIQRAADSKPTDLHIYELGPNQDQDFQYIESLLASGQAAGVFLTSEQANQELLLRALRSGVSEFFNQPVREDEVARALERFQEKRASRTLQPAGKIITVLGSKGGVGTSTIAVNLATALSENRDAGSIALVDMNMVTGEIPLFLEINTGHGYHWGEIAKNISRVDATYLMNIMHRYDANLYVLASPGSPNHLTVSPEIVERVFHLLRRNFRFIVVDGGVSLDRVSSKVLQMSDQVFLVVTLALPYLANANKIINNFSYWGYPPKERTKVIINRYLKGSDITLQEAENTLQRKIFWTFPNDFGTTMAAINQGRPLQVFAPKAAITESFEKLSGLLAASEGQSKNNGGGILRRLFPVKGK